MRQFVTCFSRQFTIRVLRYFDGVRHHNGGRGRLLVQDLFQQIVEFKVHSVRPRRAEDKAVTLARPARCAEYKGSIHVQLLPHVFLTQPIVGLQPFDPGMALLCTAGVAVGAQFLRYFGEDVAVVRVTPYALLDLNVGGNS